ncbi:hypothetical protein [Corynebacterium sp. HS2168-gen11]|uniref:hypothetical protein n=1 Tax=Corynebacterium sp. HS2168-gen11 TaxID=2974027 RepID=UPI00216B0972|nr:hypothetical protein [Corynebacterium sp. HS2168-gen11]MCS4535810.1 hypothetical protein [Corynebacterium sp. HS2168-gen11]
MLDDALRDGLHMRITDESVVTPMVFSGRGEEHLQRCRGVGGGRVSVVVRASVVRARRRSDACAPSRF